MAGRGPPLARFWLIVTLAAVSTRFSSCVSDGSVTRRAGEDVSLVIKYSYPYGYTPESAYCVTGDLQLNLTGIALPSNVSAPIDTDRTDTSKTVTWDGDGALTGVQGLTCVAGDRQSVTGPIIHPQASLVTTYRIVTLNKAEDLQLPLNTNSGQVWWQKEVLQGTPEWKNATLTNNKELFIPSDQLQGSGIYSVMVTTPATTHTRQRDENGVFHLVVRECPAQRCGSSCRDWCPDCLHGGVCDATTCECVCPPGVMGHRCQTICQEGYIGRNCTVLLDTDPKQQVVCVGAPLGCTCAPGYSGEYCNTECHYGSNKWGVDCAQTCHDCWSWCHSSGRCSGQQQSCSRWGQCRGTQKRRCGEGDLGLPRLRRRPIVTSMSQSGADVSFKVWQQGYDDGELPSGAKIYSYLLKYWSATQGEKTKTVQATTITTITTTTQLTDLVPGMTYYLKVMVMVLFGSYTCNAQRGRVHTVTFNTTCPNHPPQPDLGRVSANSFSLDVHWKTVSWLDRCDFENKLQVTSKAPGEYGQTFYPTGTYRNVGNLKANTEYTVSLSTCFKNNNNNCSVSATTTKRTKPGELVVEGQVQGDVARFNWGQKSGGVDNLEYRTSYQIKSRRYGKLLKSRPMSVWSDRTSREITVVPYSTVTLQVEVKNNEGQGPDGYNDVVVPSAEPGQVTNLRVVADVTAVTVTWNKPVDDPPKGKLQSFRVTCSTAVQVVAQRTVSARQTTNGYQTIIQNLDPGIEYNIKIEAKNQGVAKYGAAATATAITTLGGQVEKLTVNATKSSVTLTWQPPPDTEEAVISWYNVLLYSADKRTLVLNKTVQVTQVKLEGLDADREYLAEVKACNSKQCGAMKKLPCWTRPSPPRLQGSGTVGLVAANDSTITILLPLLSNPPGWHYVAVQKEGRQPRLAGWKEKMRKQAEDLVIAHNPKPRRPRREVPDDTEMYITAEVYQEGGENPLKVTVGGNTTYEHPYPNRPLEKDAGYWIVVVTEKWSGFNVERHISTPQRFVAASSTSPGTIVGLMIGMAAAAVAVAMAVAAVVMYFRKRRAKLTERLQTDYNVDAPEGGAPWPEDSPIPMVSISDGRQNNLDDENIYANVTLEVTESDLEAYLLRAVMSRETKIEFDEVPSFMSSAYAVSARPENTRKNRYRNKVTYDDTRVILPLYDNIPNSDYINANFVEGPKRPAAFIAAEGPLKETVGAFWRMAWHTDCRVIVMVAKMKEEQQVKVDQYWPEGQPWITEGVTVTPKGITINMDFVKRTFTMSVGNKHKEIIQYQYTGWPDHGVPERANALAHMIELIRRDCGSSEQLVVHCSTGIGRTGTVILVMYLLDQLEARGAVNIGEALKVLRRGRGRLVENTEQYIFAHQMLYQVLFSFKTTFSCQSFENLLSALRRRNTPDGLSQNQRLYQRLKDIPKDLSFKHGKDPACAYLNRNQHILPADNSMAYLQGKGYDTEVQYLNVIKFNGIDQKDAYLAGEHPQKHTLAKMWRLVYERRVAVWVLVHTFQPRDPEFPDVACESSALQENMTLKVSSTQTFQNYDEQEVDIHVTEMGNVVTHKCLLIYLRGWPAAASLPASPGPLLSVIERAEAFSSPEHPPLFTCKDGVTGCGVVAALLIAVLRARRLQEVDIYHSVATVQQSRPEFIVSLEQYEFLHTAVVAFFRTNDHYDNLAEDSTTRMISLKKSH